MIYYATCFGVGHIIKTHKKSAYGTSTRLLSEIWTMHFIIYRGVSCILNQFYLLNYPDPPESCQTWNTAKIMDMTWKFVRDKRLLHDHHLKVFFLAHEAVTRHWEGHTFRNINFGKQRTQCKMLRGRGERDEYQHYGDNQYVYMHSLIRLYQ